MLPVDPLSEESPSETPLLSSEAIPRAMSTPTVAAIATPKTNAPAVLSGLGVVTKMIADMIWGPAIIVMARDKIAWSMASSRPKVHRRLMFRLSMTMAAFVLNATTKPQMPPVINAREGLPVTSVRGRPLL
jgi:hypothetical protein